ncbi:mitochondrial RNA pseudouridine synthase Rpusd4-like isoform X2 [Vespa velutina]|uniref:mitochondrial RNA pseudouridine synthase Rpusd4-like isoform X2 n=1 Tax=Vespa velutina TaxID=202808 RepID=UPI001FB23BB5|nr:mitochondrial RNA pseudouridine synthase Rpusd4-like isoform X2 [Vespa velutina]
MGTGNINNMPNVILKFSFSAPLRACTTKKQRQKFLNRHFTDDVKYTVKKEKIIHPYRKLHPWKSHESFSQYLLNNVIYNKVPNGVDYTLEDSMPFLAEKLGYAELIIVKTPEKFMSGVTLLAANKTLQDAINSSYQSSIGMKILNKTYWTVTSRVPSQIKGTEHLCMSKLFNRSESEKRVVIEEKWSKKAEKRREIKVLNIEFNIISNSTNNLSSLIEMKASTIKWHALRLFASTRLYTPILGDNIYGSRIQNIAGKWLLVSPFAKTNNNLAEVNPKLLEILYLTKAKRELIPCHVHARSVILPKFKGESLTIEAPLISPFDWTCRQLKFKNIPELQEINE